MTNRRSAHTLRLPIPRTSTRSCRLIITAVKTVSKQEQREGRMSTKRNAGIHGADWQILHARDAGALQPGR